MKQKKIPIKYKKERVLLSDVLPFETPITFSNRHFYNFLVENRIEYGKETISWAADNATLENTIKLLFGLKNENSPVYATITYRTDDDLEQAISRIDNNGFFSHDPITYSVTVSNLAESKFMSNHLLTRKKYSRLNDNIIFDTLDEYRAVVADLYQIKKDISINRVERQITIKKGDPNFEKLTIIGNVIVKTVFFFKLSKRMFRKIPFGYKISHKESDFRQLSIPHPISQLAIIEFYERYKNMILYYSNISAYSIRKPFKVAKMLYHKDKTHLDNLSDSHEHDSVEEYSKEYENLKTFFSYKSYSNIHKFYESYKYHRCEKKYNKLFKFDISKCFDSVYTHSIVWALYNKSIVKADIQKSDRTFAAMFDSLMGNINHGETNGIIIGPEFSRIFAELILQEIDFRIQVNLRNHYNLIHKKDYELFRYVDDYFLFFNNENDKNVILTCVKLQLKEFGMYLNDSKIKSYNKPIITEITIAKSRISDLFNKYLSIKKKEDGSFDTELLESDTDKKQSERYSLYISSNKLITKFKTIIKETQVEYKDVLNYSLAAIDRKVLKLIREFHKLSNKKDHELKFVRAFLEILDVTFFIYSVSPRVNSTIKLCMVISKVIKYLRRNKGFSFDNSHLILKKIYDDISLVLKNNKNGEHTPVETLYLLVALRELGREYRIDVNTLRIYFDIQNGSKDTKLDYFSIVVLLFYIGDKVRYKDLRRDIEKCIILKFEQRITLTDSAEAIFLFFDMLTCPYVELSFKRNLLKLYGVEDAELQLNIIRQRKYWFTKWSNFKFEKELDAKRSQEVY